MPHDTFLAHFKPQILGSWAQKFKLIYISLNHCPGTVLRKRPLLFSVGEETFGYSCTPGWKPSYLCPVGPRTTEVPHPVA